MPQNIILIMMDQQHYDSLGANGTQEARTPNIDSLASGGESEKLLMPMRSVKCAGHFTR